MGIEHNKWEENKNEWHHHGTCNEASFSFKHSNPINIPTINQSDGLCITVDISL
jgi:hypothetical protein